MPIAPKELGKKAFFTKTGARKEAYTTILVARKEAYCTESGAGKGYFSQMIKSKQSGMLSSKASWSRVSGKGSQSSLESLSGDNSKSG